MWITTGYVRRVLIQMAHDVVYIYIYIMHLYQLTACSNSDSDVIHEIHGSVPMNSS